VTPSSPGDRRAFSITELLTSIAIIAVLLSILLPLLSHARELGYRTVCSGNLRQLGAAFTAYLHDHRHFPRAANTPEWRYGGVAFVGPARTAVVEEGRPLNTYLSDRLPSRSSEVAAIFRCPGDRGVFVAGSAPNRPGASVLNDERCFDRYGTSYRANGNVVAPLRLEHDAEPRPLADHEVLVEPSRLLVLGDSEWYYATRPSTDAESALDASWHREGHAGNFLAMDGSVRFVRFSTSPSFEYTLSPMPLVPPAQ
jgi:prepilin-type N-terminal cleavage/methylation domain-containing protein